MIIAMSSIFFNVNISQDVQVGRSEEARFCLLFLTVLAIPRGRPAQFDGVATTCYIAHEGGIDETTCGDP
jgi:hypothetical protein